MLTRSLDKLFIQFLFGSMIMLIDHFSKAIRMKLNIRNGFEIVIPYFIAYKLYGSSSTKSHQKNQLDMALRSGFKFLSGTRDAPQNNLIIYTYNSICKICWTDDFNNESAEILKKIIAQHEVTFKR